MKKRTKITFSLTLVICLLLSILPAAPVVAVAAEETLTSSITESATIGTPTVAEETAAVQEELPVLQLDADCQILRHVDPEVFAAGNHIARLPEEETLSSYVFLNADGSKTAYFMDQPVKFENTDGAAVEKNLTLTAATEGYTTTQNDIQLTIPTDPANGIRLVYDNHYISLIPQGGTLTAGAQATDGSVTYPDYYGEGMSLRYTPTLSGVKEDILLDSYSGVNSFTFRLNTGGLKLYQASGRYFLAESKTSVDRIELGDVVAYDANTQFSIGTMTAQTIMDGQAYMLTLTVDEAFLTDENTVYPVIIDPTLEVKGSDSSSNIIDAPIFDGYPNTNYGNFIFNRVGKVSAYGVGRTVVKLPTLTESDTYTSLSADNITSVKFYVKEASGTAAISVSVYPLVGNSVWTESNVTWNNVGSADGAAIDTQSLSYTNWKSFDITSLVKKWKTGDYDANCGFIMIGSSTTNKSFFASEHSTADSRPYVVMTYQLDSESISVLEGGTHPLSIPEVTDTITWTSSNTAVATVSTTGVVTGVKAGQATITASTGSTVHQTFTVYVKISDGVYQISYANMMLGTYGGIEDNTTAFLFESKNSGLAQLQQLWKITYLGSGYYSIRPMYKLDMALHVTSGAVDITHVGTTDTLSGVPLSSRWTIEYASTGYLFMYVGTSSLTMRCSAPYPTASIIAEVYSSTIASFKWTLTKVSETLGGAMLYNNATQSVIENPSKHIEIGETKTLSALGLCAVAYSNNTISQTFYWYTDNSDVVTVNSSTGEITGVSTGTATITGRVYRGGKYHYVKYGVCVGYPKLFDDLIDLGCIQYYKCDETNDGLFLATTPLAEIFNSKSIYTLSKNTDGTDSRSIAAYYDDWYIYAIDNNATVSYGLFKMREVENDGLDGDDPGVTISFVSFNRLQLSLCLNSPTLANQYNLFLALEKVTGPEVSEYDAVLAEYFAKTASSGAYLVAEKYVSFIASGAEENEIAVPLNCISIFTCLDNIETQLNNPLISQEERAPLLTQHAFYSRIPTALNRINSDAGCSIFNKTNWTLSINNTNNLSLPEKQAILCCFTANETFNSFAAEVQFHAAALYDWKADIPILGNSWYAAALRADMAVGEEAESGFFDDYYDLSSDIVQKQVSTHGEY